MKKSYIIIIYFTIFLGLLFCNQYTLRNSTDLVNDLENINIAFRILTGIGLILLIYMLSNIGEGFYDKLYEIKDKALLSESPSELVDLRNELEEYRKKAYSNHAKYDVDRVIVYINSRLKHDFK